MMENRRELIQFLVEAKQNAYAAGVNYVDPKTPDSHESHYRDIH